MTNKEIVDEKEYRNIDGYLFLPDGGREIPLAVETINWLMLKGFSQLTDTELKLIRASAVRIIAEIDVISPRQNTKINKKVR